MSKLLSHTIFFVFIQLAVVIADPASDIASIGLLPTQKPAQTLSKERNPFVRRETKVAATTNNQETEERQLRALLGRMSVTGFIRGQDSTKVLLQNLILKKGGTLPPLIENQTEQLIVAKITENQVEIDFVQTDEDASPRKILIPINLQPQVEIHATAPPPAKALPKGIKVTPVHSTNSPPVETGKL
ncbi:MAG: hypothetical protein ABI443_09915 [Chthoniobacterales bacterium]